VDSFLPRPITPDYVPRKTGIDCSTQIEDPTELFNFDKEVQPMLNVIVDKTIEQALFECRAEAELVALNDAAEVFKRKKEEELKWLKEREKKSVEESRAKVELNGQKMRERNRMDELRKLIAGRYCFRQILPRIVEDVFADLYARGEWVEDTVSAINNRILPDLSNQVSIRADKLNQVQQVVDGMILDAKAKYDTIHYVDRRAVSRVILTLNIPSVKANTSSDVKLGPFELDKDDTILTLVIKIQNKLTNAGVTLPFVIDNKMLQDYLSSAAGRQIAIDAPLVNFRLPGALTVAM